jgi:protocatechuate 3,4-dioxygenase beta subunit
MADVVMDRRRALAVIGGAGAALVAGACGNGTNEGVGGSSTAPTSAAGTSTTAVGAATGPVTADRFGAAASCQLSPSLTEGPYYIDVDSIRGDIREDRQGTRLLLAARILDSDGCTPVKDAVFEIWHCDASGNYSGFQASAGGAGGGGPGGGGPGGGGPGGGGPGGSNSPTDGARFLRGAQVTNGDGIAQITTIYPGWYQGRTVHVHAKVFISNAEVLTTQLFFDDELNDEVFAAAPYSAHGQRSTRNRDDGIFSQKTVMTAARDGDGYLALINIGVDR